MGAAIAPSRPTRIIRVASLMPVEGARKVLILDEFHLIQPEVPARLLKTVEEPADRATVFVILADDVPVDLVTIASRCVRIDFRALARATVARTSCWPGARRTTRSPRRPGRGGNLDRARVLALDPGLSATRTDAFTGLPHRLDGTGPRLPGGRRAARAHRRRRRRR